ncbi:hypothetical protein WMY93_021594 [Mugilogobius chulae]|uniref:AAA+ ATPase domain-containing protein n=1 Tax=Mugilogobius chulae TaxID=88201 RepID=A0AAW0NL90_9GOBI
MDNGQEQNANQHPDFRGRARLLTEEIRQGWAKLQVSNLRISDSGKYQCFVQTGAGADYGTLTLTVFAPFKSIDKSVEALADSGEPKQLHLHFPDATATIRIPDDFPVPTKRNTALIVVLCCALSLLAAIILMILLYKFKQKGLRSVSTRDLVDALGRVFTLPKVKRQDSINDEEKAKINQTDVTDRLKTSLKDHYLKWIENLPKETHRDTDSLYNIPGKWRSLLLEGPTGSGKTTAAQMIVSSWTQKPASDLPDHVFYVDGSRANSSLLDEIMTQLSLEDVAAETDLRAALSGGSLLIVDGYTEGNVLFDESLQRLLFDQRGCRVLVTTGLEQSKVREMIGAEATVTLQTPRQKY